MKQEVCKIFATLCENLLESSTAMNLIASNPGGSQVVKYLHKELGLGHDLDYREIPKISWSELKGTRRGAWVVLKGNKGTGAIKAYGDSYLAVASDGGDIKTKEDSRGGNILDFFKEHIGKPTQFFAAMNTSAASDKKHKRKENNRPAADEIVDQDSLVKKFKPLWARAIEAAIADIKGHIANQIKNGAFDKAKRKLDQVSSLQNNLDRLEVGDFSETPGNIKTAVHTAILMAASYYYPDETGDINKDYRGYTSQLTTGPRKLLNDISKGDTKKLGTILGFFKKALISG